MILSVKTKEIRKGGAMDEVLSKDEAADMLDAIARRIKEGLLGDEITAEELLNEVESEIDNVALDRE